jgi:chromate transport protein ChrA
MIREATMSRTEYILYVVLFNALSLGNGTVMVPMFEKTFTEESGLLPLEQLLFAFAVGQATPGQANLYVASVGYMLFGVPTALLAMLAINLPGYLMLPLARAYERIRELGWVRRLTAGLTSASVGLIAVSVVNIAGHALDHPSGWVAFALTLLLTRLWKCNSLLGLTVASGTGILVRVYA